MRTRKEQRETNITFAYLTYCELIKKPYFLNNEFSFSTIRPIIINVRKSNKQNDIRIVFNTMLRYKFLEISRRCGNRNQASRYRIINQARKTKVENTIYFD